MKAVQITGPSEMRVIEMEKPVVAPGQILVKIEYVGFCGSDLNTYLGRIISFASNPVAIIPPVFTSIEITDGSLTTIPFPFIVTNMFAVPKSIPISLELNDKKFIVISFLSHQPLFAFLSLKIYLHILNLRLQYGLTVEFLIF